MRSIKSYCIAGAIFTLIVGTISHFVYEWSGNHFIAGLFFPVNESTWEHMKLVFSPMLVYALVAGNRLLRENPCFLYASFAGILAGTWLIPVIFYIYTGILGYHKAWLDILTFVVSVIAAYAVIYRAALNCRRKGFVIIKLILIAQLAAFIIFTVYPPGIGLFSVP